MKIIELNIGLSSKTLGNLNPCEVLNALTGRGFECLVYRLVESTSKDGKEVCLAWKGKPPGDWQNQLASLSDKLGQDCIGIAGFIGHAPYDAFIPSLWVEPSPEPAENLLARWDAGEKLTDKQASEAYAHHEKQVRESREVSAESETARLANAEFLTFTGLEDSKAIFTASNGAVRKLGKAWIKELCQGCHSSTPELLKGWDALTAPRARGFTLQEFLGYLEFSIIPDSRESGFDGYADDLETALEFLKQSTFNPVKHLH